MMLYHLHWHSRLGNGYVVCSPFIMNGSVCIALGWSVRKAAAVAHTAGNTITRLYALSQLKHCV